ncbi:calmodulin-regulated spectrin-associated protein patronin isoform X3 [Leptinotarsa decemlineata]|uniref:calmodulin-regulated spectrin-associated protein patronin isoform X3 n=1 Tax=Leptinotarsa decemlineata TaxID=7539 RepID=UPI003D30D0B7
MWSAISKIFTKNSSISNVQSGENTSGEMDRGERRIADMDDTFVSKLAKQRASMKWLLSKAFNNKIPENLREPFYRDHENQEHLKPQIAGGLASAEIYCLALGNIYSDPNYHNLNHWAILQTLARKGVNEPSDVQLTETTLIQTNPLRMAAHMAVIEMIMSLYTKEVVTPERILATVQRFNHGRAPTPSVPENHEQGLLLWVSHACDALRKRIEQETDDKGIMNGGEGDRLKVPDFPPLRELKDLCDGVGLAALISYYCPDELHWTEIRISCVPSVQDSLYNLRLLHDFCSRCLPTSIYHLMPEDVTYMRGSMTQNLIVFLADLFNVIEINPAKCVRYPGMDKFSNDGLPSSNAHGVMHKRNLLQTVMAPIPDLRSGIDDPADPSAFQVSRSTPTHLPLRKTNSLQQSVSEMTEDSLRRGSEDSFVVHRGKNIPTLRSVVQEEPLIPARLKVSKEKHNNDSKADERGEIAAGRPSNWEDTRKPTYAGRRSRRNSTSDDSQLTIENFGGSQDNLNFIGRNPDKEVAVHIGRKISAPSFPTPIENAPTRSTYQDARGSFQLGYDNGYEEKQDNGTEKFKLKRQLSSDDIAFRKIGANLGADRENIIMKDLVDGEVTKKLSFADLGKQKVQGESKAIQLVYMNDKEEYPSKSSFYNKLGNANSNEKKTTFATLPNTTTWQQQSTQNQQSGENNADETISPSNVMNVQLTDIRMKLEEKRRHIESEKRRMEMAMNKQRQKVGKAAFLQAVVKGRGNLLKTPTDTESNPNSAEGSETQSPSTESAPTPKSQRPVTLKEIDDINNVEGIWPNDGHPYVETRKTPDMDNMDLEQYQRSIAQMNTSLHDIQSDMQRLASQQNHAQQQHQQNLIAQQQRQILALQQQQYQSIQSQSPMIPQYTSQPSYQPQMYQPPQQVYASPLQSSASAPHIPQALYAQQRIQEQPQFFLHEPAAPMSPVPPVTPQRRTWAQQPQPPPIPMESYHQPELRTWNKPQSTGGGFVLHDTDRYDTRYQEQPRYQESNRYSESPRYQNGGGEEHPLQHSSSFTLSQQHHHSHYGTSHSTPSASPQHRNIHRQISQLLDDSKRAPVSLQQMDNREPPQRKSSITHAPIPAPPPDDMEPQNISFIGNAADKLSEGLSRLNITSGSRTYRIPSPTRPAITRNSFQPSPSPPNLEPPPIGEVSSLDNDPSTQKGFYISFDDDQPKRPKPPLRTKRMSPKKERSYVESPEEAIERREEQQRQELKKRLERELVEEKLRNEEEDRRRQALIEQERERLRAKREASQERQKVNAASAIIIGNDLSNPDPDLDYERERKKEKIMMLSLQRRQQQEEAKARKEAEAQAKKEQEKMKEEEKARKKEEQVARRQAIFEQYKLKKALEEAEREGKTLDRAELSSLKPAPKMRPKGNTRPRPKTIHIDSGSVQMAEGMSSRGKKGSSSNLAYAPSTMKRDYYRGSQDSLADRSMSSGMLYKDPSPAQVRGRPKYSAYQNFKGRKSSSMMNLYGSSTDQDSLAYRFGDTDSGLGRATPPRRAPSPGMSMRHLTSPSGPGSLPGLMSKGRRMFDDGSSDISSTPSSMMDYNGPRLYKQPAMKSNRSIMLNAVEYCVFPGVVNREAKKRVLEEINRSESKHFLILFRDAGCQFRALYSYCPEREEITKLYGTGPKQVNDKMFDKFFKYNSGGKCFSQVHTKHLTVTIDAFTIHNSLWQGKKVNLPNKKDMALVI